MNDCELEQSAEIAQRAERVNPSMGALFMLLDTKNGNVYYNLNVSIRLNPLQLLSVMHYASVQTFVDKFVMSDGCCNVDKRITAENFNTAELAYGGYCSFVYYMIDGIIYVAEYYTDTETNTDYGVKLSENETMLDRFKMLPLREFVKANYFDNNTEMFYQVFPKFEGGF